MERSFSCVKGEKVILTDSNSQTFIGVVKSINPVLGRIVLTDIIQIPGEKPVIGYRNFDRQEIVKLKKWEADKELDDSVNGDCANKSVNEVECDRQKCNQQNLQELPVSNSELEKFKKIQSKYRYIKNCSTNFYSAISLLKSSTKIGIYAKDISKGRLKKPSVLVLTTHSNVLVFDLVTLRKDVLQKWFKKILESSEIIKVTYDSRLLSDCLKHNYSINLENIRDVEAEDIMVVFEERKMIRKHSRSLKYLIRVYLGIETEEFNEVEDIWEKRPLPENLIEGLVCEALYLIPLQEAIERKYLQRLVNASQVYNSHVRNLDLFDFLHLELKKTLRKQMIKLVTPTNRTRSDCKSREILG